MPFCVKQEKKDLVTGNKMSADVFGKGEEHTPKSHGHFLNF